MLHNAAGGGGRGVARVQLLRPLISCNYGQLSHMAANWTSHTCGKKGKRQKRENSSAAGCSLFCGELGSNCQIGHRNRQPLCHPLLPHLHTSRCSHAADRLYVWVLCREVEIFGHFSMSQLLHLCDSRKASAAVLDRWGPRSLHFSASSTLREERPEGGIKFPCFFSFMQPAASCWGSVTQRREGGQGLNVTGQVSMWMADRKIKVETTSAHWRPPCYATPNRPRSD